MRELINYEHLQELQHFAKLGRMSASLLHEITNPLTAALLNLELSDKQSAGVRRAREDMKLMRRYIEAARQQVRLQARPTTFRVQPQLDQLERVVAPLARKAGVQLYIEPPPDCQLYGDPVKFQHIISNLLVNAIQAYDDNEAAYIKRRPVRLRLRYDDGLLTIVVTDWAKVIPSENLLRLFDAFYTTKAQSGNGLGIGLAIVKQYVAADFQGSIRVSSSLEKGTRFTVTLPVRKA